VWCLQQQKAADAKKMGMKYEKCFTGEMFVEWVQSLGNGHSKQEIAELGEMLIKVWPSRTRVSCAMCRVRSDHSLPDLCAGDAHCCAGGQ